MTTTEKQIKLAIKRDGEWITFHYPMNKPAWKIALNELKQSHPELRIIYP